MDIQVVRPADLPKGAVRYAQRKMAHLARYSREPVRLARLAFAISANPAASRPVHLRAQLDVDGRLLVAHADAVTVREAVDAVDGRLRSRLSRINPHWEARRGRRPHRDRRLTANPQDPASPEGPPDAEEPQDAASAA